MADFLYIPGILNSFTGLTTTVVNVYTAQGGNWSVTAWVNFGATALYWGATSALTLMDNLLRKLIKTPGDIELAQQSRS
jgi:hypothetical protein